jgi:hypothetical protein
MSGSKSGFPLARVLHPNSVFAECDEDHISSPFTRLLEGLAQDRMSGYACWFNMTLHRPVPSLAALLLIATGIPVYFLWVRLRRD